MLNAFKMRLLAIDPALRSSGVAVLEQNAGKIHCLHHGTIRNPPALSFSGCLVTIHREIALLVERFQPEACAVESVIFVQNSRTAVTLGAARGCALLAVGQSGLPIYEYPPRRVKQAVAGTGTAQKNQVGFMVRVLLGLTETPEPDAADALAIGITHLQMSASPMSRHSAKVSL